jgi:hypothetical protein
MEENDLEPVSFYFTSALNHPDPLPSEELRRVIMFYCLQGFQVVVSDSIVCDNVSLRELAQVSPSSHSLPQDLDVMLRCGSVKVALRNTERDLLQFHEKRKNQENPSPNLPNDDYVRFLVDNCPEGSTVAWDLGSVSKQFEKNLVRAFSPEHIPMKPVVSASSAAVVNGFIQYQQQSGKQVNYADIWAIIESPTSEHPIKLSQSEVESLNKDSKNVHQRIAEAYSNNVPMSLGMPLEVGVLRVPETFQFGHLSVEAPDGYEKRWDTQVVDSPKIFEEVPTWAFDPRLLSQIPAQVLQTIYENDIKEYQELIRLIRKWKTLAQMPTTLDLGRAKMQSMIADIASAYEKYCYELEKIFHEVAATPIWTEAVARSKKRRSGIVFKTCTNGISQGISVIPIIGGIISTMLGTVLLLYGAKRDWSTHSAKKEVNHLIGDLEPVQIDAPRLVRRHYRNRIQAERDRLESTHP